MKTFLLSSLRLLVVAMLGMASCRCHARSPMVNASRLQRNAPTTVALVPVEFPVFANMAWPAQPDAEFTPMTAKELDQLDALTVQLWRGVAADQRVAVASAAAALGMRLSYLEVEQTKLWLLRDSPDAPNGTGCFVFRDEPAPPGAILLQAPHVYFDRGTGYIAAALFMAPASANRVHAVIGNTAHRYVQADGSKQRLDQNLADAAHNADHPMAHVSAALSAAFPMTIVQLHGFDADNHDLDQIDAVVSAGVSPTSRAVNTAADALRALGLRVAVFPDDTQALGATTNVQGSSARLFQRGFVHIELATGVRDRLRKNREQAQALASIVMALPMELVP